MEKIWLVIQESNVDGEIMINVTPCISKETAKEVMDTEVDKLLSSGKYEGLDLDEIEKAMHEDDWDCDFNVERDDTHFYIGCNVDDYYEYIDIKEKDIQF